MVVEELDYKNIQTNQKNIFDPIVRFRQKKKFEVYMPTQPKSKSKGKRNALKELLASSLDKRKNNSGS